MVVDAAVHPVTATKGDDFRRIRWGGEEWGFLGRTAYVGFTRLSNSEQPTFFLSKICLFFNSNIAPSQDVFVSWLESTSEYLTIFTQCEISNGCAWLYAQLQKTRYPD